MKKEMKVFKFYSADLFYAVIAPDETQAKDYLFEWAGKMSIDKVEEIPESEWDDKTITMYEDGDKSRGKYMSSIREQIMWDATHLVYTNDESIID